MKKILTNPKKQPMKTTPTLKRTDPKRNHTYTVDKALHAMAIEKLLTVLNEQLTEDAKENEDICYAMDFAKTVLKNTKTNSTVN